MLAILSSSGSGGMEASSDGETAHCSIVNRKTAAVISRFNTVQNPYIITLRAKKKSPLPRRLVPVFSERLSKAAGRTPILTRTYAFKAMVRCPYSATGSESRRKSRLVS